MVKQDGSHNETGMPQVRALQRGVEMLFLLIDSERPLSVTELARQTQLPKPTVTRLLGTLVEGGYVVTDPASGHYTIGPEVARRFLMARLDPHIAAQIRETMVRLRNDSGETVGLWLPVYPDRVCIEQVESAHGLRRVHDIGRRWPLTTGSSGRVYLATLSDEEIERTLALRPLRPVTPFSIVDNEAFYREIEQTRKDGYSISVSQTNVGMGGLAAAVRGNDGRPIAMLSISGPEARWGAAAMVAFAPTLVAAVSRLSGQNWR